MLRCDICRGHAHAGLEHLHNTGQTLCITCTREILARRENSAEKKEKREKIRIVRPQAA
jgi:hypothetical protein